MSKSVVQFLRGLDISGVDFGSADQVLSEAAGEGLARRSRQRSLATAIAAVLPSTAPLGGMQRLQWLKMRDVGLKAASLPPELHHLASLEHLSLARNQLTSLSAILGWPKIFPSLRVLICRKNSLANVHEIPSDLFECPNLQVIDFSCNQLQEVPSGITSATGLLVLNLSNNKITTVPTNLFVHCTELMLLDLSDNQLERLPAQLRRCTSLQQLYLSRNPLSMAQLRSIAAIKSLEILHLSDTDRRLDNLPSELDRLQKLWDLDLSVNQLLRIPEPVFQMHALRKLNVSFNELDEISSLTDNWPLLEYLNLSHNKLSGLPSGLTRLTKLRKLYVNDNLLTFSGLPTGIGKLMDLEIFNAANNMLENIPEGLCRCGRLKHLLLSSNQLVTLPDAIHYLIESLKTFDVERNPNLRFPPKPPELNRGAGLAFYNIDFSLDSQLQQMRGLPPETTEATEHAKDAAARLRRLKRRRLDGGDNEEGSNAVLAGMRHVATEKETIMRDREESDTVVKQISAKRWQDTLSKPNLNYSEIFDQDAGLEAGVEAWYIDEFYPKRCDSGGVFCEGDCYILLETVVGEGGAFSWRIYYWIGSKASLDKRACAAMHAVNLRNFLGADTQTRREEEGEETEDFQKLFCDTLRVVEGSTGDSGFLHVQEKQFVLKLYRLFAQEKQMYITSMPVSPLSLDPKFVYLLDANSRLYLWLGSQSRVLIQTKARLLAEKISQRERLNEADILPEAEGRESNEFWAVMTGLWTPPPLVNWNIDQSDLPAPTAAQQPEEATWKAIVKQRAARKQELLNAYPKPPIITTIPAPARDYIPVDWKLPKPIVYDVKLGKGFLELPQAELPTGQLTRQILDPKHVYLVDSGGELFVWMGEKSTKFLRYAGAKLAEELSEMMPRGCFGGAEDSVIADIVSNGTLSHKRPPPQICVQSAECQIFRAQFVGWEPAMAVDFTRTAESVARRGADPNVIMERDKMRTDLRALLAPREQPISRQEALQLLEELNQELVEPPDLEADFSSGSPTPSIQQFIILDRKWVPVDALWFGHFFNKDSYIVIARYWDYDETCGASGEELEDKTELCDSSVGRPAAGAAAEVDGSPGEEEEEERTKAVVYFWQGREASDLAWLTFNFSLRKDMEKRLAQNPRAEGRPFGVEFKRVRQQQEDLYFMAHFMRRMVIHSGHYRDRESSDRLAAPQMYHLRMNGNAIATRCIQVSPTASTLNSCFSYIIRVPNTMTGASEEDLVYIWLGEKSHPEDELLLRAICAQLYSQAEIIILPEGTESSFFWNILGGRKIYDKNADYMQHVRLFRLSNDAGYFTSSEKCADFCQDDLINEDVMLLDTGDQIYVWLGKKTSDVEVKLSLQAARLYKEHMSRLQPNRPRHLKLTAKNAEPFNFKRCFHGWGPFREPKDWSG